MSNILSAKIEVTAPGVAEAFNAVAGGAGKAERALFSIEQQVAKFGSGVRSFTPNITAMKNAFGFLPPALEKTQASLQKLPGAANQATLAMVNLGRVVQDSPFGFLGIANNLNPLLESFQRLKATTGTTGGALKALGSSLLGAGGLGFALSIVSTALIVFGDRLFGTGRKAKEAEDAIKSLASNFASQAAQLTTLVGIVQNVNTKYDDKQKALKAINQEYASYLGNLDKEKVTAENIADAYDKIVEAMIRQAVVKGIQDEIAKAVEETAKKILVLQIAQEKARLADEERNKGTAAAIETEKKRKQQIDFNTQSLNTFTKGARDGTIAQQEYNNEQKTAQANALNLDGRIQGLKDTLLKMLSPLLNLTTNFDDLGIKLNKSAKAAKVAAFEYDALKAIFNDLISLQKLFSGQLEKEIKLRAAIKLDFSGGAGSAFTAFTKELPVISDRLQKDVDGFTKRNPILLEAAAFLKIRIDTDKALEALDKQLGQSIRAAKFSALEDLAGAFGDIASGQKSITQSIVSVLSNLLAQIGKALVAYGVAKTGLEKILNNPALPGGFAIALGLSAIAAASLLKNFQGRALGGPVKKGQPYIVGEVGRELFIPDTGGRIVSNSELRSRTPNIQGGNMAVQVVGQLLLRGNDLVAAIANANKSQTRLT